MNLTNEYINLISIRLYKEQGAWGVAFIGIRNGFGKASSNPDQGSSRLILHKCKKKMNK